MKSIVILISGTGSNMAAIVRAAEAQRWGERLGARVAAVIGWIAYTMTRFRIFGPADLPAEVGDAEDVVKIVSSRLAEERLDIG